MQITSDMVKELRQKSGAGIMECKTALKESNGSIEEAITALRKKGLAKAGKKADRETGDGAIGSYIHAGGKIGVLLKLQCETDFVANTPDFQELLKDICMHIAASRPRFVSRDEVTPEILEKEKEIFAHQARESGKPEKVIDKIVAGKMEKFYEENCLLDQDFIKDQDLTIQELIKQKIALLGENITVGEFVRFEISK
ncbi:MAG: translation elongation factor Ts [Nitrospinaceae bacterium]|nr:translation elongation factor Ts [Nitrospinaceae bacterium]NIR56740.1 translation elongation factor Ts [Nitrospinaceae bacterium]NIS87189.1 translation elongation factor Ts [Nitrospinaceae bacterium]NIT84058.1 translation elongation factor Ts [Nitrospinaceae bacterium]NIU46241.1 translation elongation factor Ts [Nitrospinaceae bacterium]